MCYQKISNIFVIRKIYCICYQKKYISWMSLFSCQREPTGCGRYHLTEHTSVTIVFIFYLLSFILLSLSLSLSFIFYLLYCYHLTLTSSTARIWTAVAVITMIRVNVANKHNNQCLWLWRCQLKTSITTQHPYVTLVHLL